MVVKVVRHVHGTTKNTTITGKGYSGMTNLQKKILKTYHRILKASVKKKFDKADDLNWKLLQLELKIKQLDDLDSKS